ncbi:hypothetical protein [Caproiciproducens sp.]
MPETAKGPGASDRLTIEMPADGFTPEKLENLTKLVESKAALIKTALGADDLPIESTGDTLRFPWFSGDFDGDTVTACAQFIAALCKTAKEKKRVTAKARDEFENPRFAMRVWLIGLGMAGDDFKPARKFLLKNLTGNAAWRYGAPKKRLPARPLTARTQARKPRRRRLPPRREKKPLPAIRARAAPEKRTKSGEIVLNTIFARESMIAPARFPFSGGWEPLSVVFRAVAGWQRRLLPPFNLRPQAGGSERPVRNRIVLAANQARW